MQLTCRSISERQRMQTVGSNWGPFTPDFFRTSRIDWTKWIGYTTEWVVLYAVWMHSETLNSFAPSWKWKANLNMNLCVELYSMFMYESSVNGWLQDRNEVLYSNFLPCWRKDWYFVASQRGTTQSIFIVLSVSFLCLGNDVLLRQGY